MKARELLPVLVGILLYIATIRICHLVADHDSDGGPSLRPCAPIVWDGDDPILGWCILDRVEYRCVQRRTAVGFSLACVDVRKSDPTRSLDDIPTGAP